MNRNERGARLYLKRRWVKRLRRLFNADPWTLPRTWGRPEKRRASR